MKKKGILNTFLLCGLMILPIFLVVNSTAVFAGDEKLLVPMDLDDTDWDVEMITITKKGEKESSPDKFIFSDGKFISDVFEKKGYMPTNYSLTLEEDGLTTRFGTMQIKDKETSFWKGKIKGDTMNGSVHTQYSSNSNKTVYFKGTLVGGALKPKEKRKPKFPAPDKVQPKPVVPPAPVAPEVPAVPAAEAVKNTEKATEAVEAKVVEVEEVIIEAPVEVESGSSTKE